MTQTNMISFKQTQANGNNSYNRPFTIRRTNIQVFLENNVVYQNQTLSSEKLQRRMMVGFIANKYKKCLYVHYQKQLPIKVKFTKGGYCRDIVIKKREFY